MATPRKAEADKLQLGRPSKRNDETDRLLFESLQLGMTRHAACAVADISEVLFYEWLKDPKFLNSCIRAENRAEAGFTNVIQAAAAAGDWKAAESWLKRRRRKDWCEMVKQELTGADGGALEIRIVEDAND